jgi:hypothetical protein
MNFSHEEEKAPEHQVEALSPSLPCRYCPAEAFWSVDAIPYCHMHLLKLSRSQEYDLYHALSSPEIVKVAPPHIHIRIYQNTRLEAICALLNDLPFSSFVDMEAIIERWLAEIGPGSQTLVRTGTGYYHVESTSIHCNAPIIKLARAPEGDMAGFMNRLNTFSIMIRSAIAGDHLEVPHT